MAGKRSKSDIVGDILTLIQAKNGRMKPTHIMYKANLSYAQLTSYLDDLVNKELIPDILTEKNNHYFIIPEKGDKFVQKFREMRQFEMSFGF